MAVPGFRAGWGKGKDEEAQQGAHGLIVPAAIRGLLSPVQASNKECAKKMTDEPGPACILEDGQQRARGARTFGDLSVIAETSAKGDGN